MTEELAAIRATDGAAMETIETVLRERAAVRGHAPDELELIAGCASNVRFDRGRVLFREGDPADTFYLVRHGTRRARDCSSRRGARRDRDARGRRGDRLVVALPSLPLALRRARARRRSRATGFDGACLRGKCEDDRGLGYDLMSRFAQVMIERLQWTRLRLLDVYGDGRRG